MTLNLLAHPAVSVGLTIACYWIALKMHERWRWIPPILVACVPIIALLLIAHEPYSAYNHGGNLLTWCLGPATVALAVPMYRNGLALRSSLPRMALIVFIGSLVGMVTAGGTAWLLGAPMPVVMSAVPKSVTTPIAIEVCRQLHGIPQITIAMVILAGVFGASFGPFLLGLFGIWENRAVGAAMGTASHGIGTASLVRHSEMQASVSSWAMAAAGVFTSLLGAILALFLR
ncbi:LrgB family protein [Occallatibacter riparius]|uniref:LrgB family protein n=1 Tax=Occallatibacter riparius TaxID=1002689 RepID=A0A9J7BNP7_9BACT|nr:LrgB family protein [Occallatibacter riparius]UWZ84508.1 LrgB family protein [Occallatibacter riparius]